MSLPRASRRSGTPVRSNSDSVVFVRETSPPVRTQQRASESSVVLQPSEQNAREGHLLGNGRLSAMAQRGRSVPSRWAAGGGGRERALARAARSPARAARVEVVDLTGPTHLGPHAP